MNKLTKNTGQNGQTALTKNTGGSEQTALTKNTGGSEQAALTENSCQSELTALAEKACRGDGDAFAEAVMLMQNSLYRIARAYLDSEADIGDALQETILNAWKNIPDLRQVEYFRTWVIRILIRECLKLRNHKKKEISYEAVFEPDEERKTIPFPERASERGEWQPGSGMVFEEMMELLDEPVREVFVLYYGEGYTTPEIAELLMMTEAAVRQRLSRGRKVIREKYFREEAAK